MDPKEKDEGRRAMAPEARVLDPKDATPEYLAYTNAMTLILQVAAMSARKGREEFAKRLAAWRDEAPRFEGERVRRDKDGEDA